jgi:hypothetical protein
VQQLEQFQIQPAETITNEDEISSLRIRFAQTVQDPVKRQAEHTNCANRIHPYKVTKAKVRITQTHVSGSDEAL